MRDEICASEMQKKKALETLPSAQVKMIRENPCGGGLLLADRSISLIVALSADDCQMECISERGLHCCYVQAACGGPVADGV